MTGPALPVPLRYLSWLKLFVDASYTPTMNFVNAAQFVAANSRYLQAAHASSLDFSTGTNANKFTIEIWRNTTTAATNRAYVSKDIYNTTGKRGWAVRSSGTVGQESQVEFWAWNNAANAYGSIVTTNAPVNWSHCVIAVDLTGPAINFYFDGSTTAATTTAVLGTLGILPTGQSAPLTVGAWNFGSSGGVMNFFDGALAGLRLWRQALPASMVPVLFNGGFPLNFARLGGSQKTYLVGAWDLLETSGARSDATASANPLTEQNGAIGQAALCTSLVERGPQGYQFFAPRFNYAPYWVALSPINNRPALRFCGQHWLRAAAPGFGSNCLAGDIFTVIRPQDLSLTNFDYAVLAADKETYDGNFTYMFPLIYNSLLQLRLRRDAATSFNNQVRGTTTLTAGNTYVTNQRGFGSGGVASLAYRINGAADPIDVNYASYNTNGGNVHNKWYGGLEGVESLILGGLNYDPGGPIEGPFAIQDRFNGYLAATVIYGGTSANGSLADIDNLAVEAWARQLANV